MASLLIIGAGAAGLTAAVELLEHKHTVTILEARDRVGGRIHTITDKFSTPVDAGAEFMHGKLPLTSALAKRADAALSLITGNHYQVFNGEVEEGDFLEDEWGELEHALRHLKEDTSIASFMDQNFPAGKYYNLRKRVKGFAEGFDLADLHKVSAKALQKEWGDSDEDHQYHIRGGYGQLTDYLRDEVIRLGGTIHLSSAVHEVRWSTGKVKVLTEDGRSYDAEKLLVTVPVGVLQKGSIRFSPPLAVHEQAIEKLAFGGVVKFMVEFEEGFWDDLSHLPFPDFTMVVSDSVVPTWWTQSPDPKPLLTGWLGGPTTFQISHEPGFLRQQAIHSIHRIFKYAEKDIESAIRVFHIADWVRDPYARGGYSYSAVESDAAIDALNQPAANTIFFAGEGLYKGPSMGTVEAALQTGKAAAKLISKRK